MTVDVNETLRMLRLTIKQMRVDTDPSVRKAHADEIAEYFDAVDEWLSKGGFLPSAWERPFGVAHSRNRDRAGGAVSLTAEFDGMLARDVLRPPDD